MQDLGWSYLSNCYQLSEIDVRPWRNDILAEVLAQRVTIRRTLIQDRPGMIKDRFMVIQS